jgi:glycosyltransferase involved in cell wall biosynthesis
MKIAIVTEDYVKGGQNAFIAELINGWPEPDQFVIVSNEENVGLDLIRCRLNRQITFITHRLNIESRLSVVTPLWLQPARKIIMAFGRYLVLGVQTFLMRRLLGRLSPDAVLISNGGYPGGQTCRAAAITGIFRQCWERPVMICHNIALRRRPFWQWPFEAVVDLLVCRGVGAIVAVSRCTERSLRERLGSAADNKLQTIYNGINPVVQMTSGRSVAAEFEIAEDAKLILTIANFEKRKGHEFLFMVFSQVVKELPQAVLLLAGSDTPGRTAELKAFVKSLNLEDKVFFLGHIEDVPTLVSQIDLLAVPSQEFESFGLINLEAMAQSKAVVATNTGGLPEVVDDGVTGYICERSDVNAFAGKIVELLNDDGKREQFGRAGYERLQELFLGSRMAKDYHQCLTTIQSDRG